MKKIKIIKNATSLLLLFIFSFTESSSVNAQLKAGDKFPLWTEGYLDIHHINTGKGESSFFIFPDGTTLLTDAGAAFSKKPWATDAKPNASRQPGEWLARYIQHMTGNIRNKKLNYALLTHFHWDHMGGIDKTSKKSASAEYLLGGITEVAEYINFEKLIDRDWPNYNWPVRLDDDKMENYKKFIAWKQKNTGMAVEKFKAGEKGQLILKNNPSAYPTFEIRNIAANGWVWTGVANNIRNHFPLLKDLDSSDYPGENKCSVAFRVSYGMFDYFTGGDLDVRDVEFASPANLWKDIETPVGMATGPVEVMKANHHGNYDANSPAFLGLLRPQVIVIQTWGASQPAMNVYRRMISKEVYPGKRDIFATNIMEETETAFNVDGIKGRQGHIVIRVNPGGDTFYIYMLNDSNEEYRITSIHGPYPSK